MKTKHIGNFGTSQRHEFLQTGCRHQWAEAHNSGECWTAFLRYHNAPSDRMTIGEFYDWLDNA